MTGRISLTVHRNASQLTPRYGPDLCTAVLRSIWQGVNGTGSPKIRPSTGRQALGRREKS
jgi:hypothetical protein